MRRLQRNRHEGLLTNRHDGLPANRHAGLSTNQRGRLWTNRHEIVALTAQTRAPSAGIVSREGGGTVIPTLGGGMGFFGGRRPPTVRLARVGGA